MKQVLHCCLFALLLIPGIGIWPVLGESFESLKQQCEMCHGPGGNSNNPVAPSIAGISPKYFDWTMDAYKNGRRKDMMMNTFAHQLSDENIRQLGDYYSKQIFKPLTQTFNSDKAREGEKLHNQYCEKCHEDGGKPGNDTPGILRGQLSSYLSKVLNEYLNKEREGNSMMIKKLGKLNSSEGKEGLEKLIQYYASTPTK